MSMEYVIDNRLTKQSLYCTSGFGEVKPEDLIGDIKTVEQRLLQSLYTRPGHEEYFAKYCKYIANIINKFIGNATLENIDIHNDSWFRHDYKMIDIDMYLTEDELDEWLTHQ